MALITTRAGKGSPLTNNEIDANFTNLNADKVETTTTITAGTGLSGGGDLSSSRTLALDVSGVTAGTYGSASSVPVLTVDDYGRITVATTATIATTLDAVTTNGNTTTNDITIGSLTATDAQFTGTTAIELPTGTTAERPVGADGKIRYNSELGEYEGYTTADGWGTIGGLSKAVSDLIILGNVDGVDAKYQELTMDDLKVNFGINQTYIQTTEPATWSLGDAWIKV